jgi:D-serine deaminase-like pyridoxal phosphate-dependent protein
VNITLADSQCVLPVSSTIRLRVSAQPPKMPYSPQVGQPLSVLDTPSMIVDLDVMESNIQKMMALLLPTGVDIRPHLKTTKSPVLAQKLINAGCKGGCVAKLSEAEVMVAGGITDVFITCEIVGGPKVARLVELCKHCATLRCVVDSVAGAQAINDALETAGVETRLQVLIDLDVGQRRTGVKPGEAPLALAQAISKMGKLELIGVHGYEGHLQHLPSREERETNCRAAMEVLAGTAGGLRKAGYESVRVVTTGGTGTATVCASFPGITEVQPGSFIFMDTDYRNAVGGDVFEQALTILSTVISKPEETRAVIDSGLKSLTTDSGFAEPLDLSWMTYQPEGDEHGSIMWEEGKRGLQVGDRIKMIPSHIDPTINLHDYYYAYRNGIIEEIWPVATRGKVQ